MRNIILSFLIGICIVGLESTTLVYGVQKELQVTTKNMVDTLGKPKIYRQFNPVVVINASYPNFTTSFGAYKFGGLTLLFGNYIVEPKNNQKDEYGFRFLALNTKGDLVFRSSGAFDSRSYTPTFYKLDDKSPVIVLIETGDEGGSWGNNVFSIMDGVVKEIGYINLAVFKRESGELSFSNIGEVTEIEKKGNLLQFNFVTDTIAYNHNGKDEKSLQARKWYYLYNNRSFKLMKK